MGAEYSGASTTLKILLVEVTISGAVFILAQAYMAVGRPGMVTIIQSIGLSLSIPMMLILIPRWGINGAAVALLTSTIARFLFVYFGFGFILKMRPPDLIPCLSDIQFMLHRLKDAGIREEGHQLTTMKSASSRSSARGAPFWYAAAGGYSAQRAVVAAAMAVMTALLVLSPISSCCCTSSR